MSQCDSLMSQHDIFVFVLMCQYDLFYQNLQLKVARLDWTQGYHIETFKKVKNFIETF